MAHVQYEGKYNHRDESAMRRKFIRKGYIILFSNYHWGEKFSEKENEMKNDNDMGVMSL